MKSKRNRLTAGLLIFTVSVIVTATAWAAIGIDVSTSKGQGSASNTVSTSAFSTSSGNELLLAFISADSTASPNTTVTKVTAGALTWALVERTNVQKGTAEIWRAFAPSALSGITVTATLSQKVDSSLTVMSFTGVNTSGTNGSGAIGAAGSGNANPGAPTATLVTQGNGSLVVGVGDDWDNSIPRTPGTGQTVVNQYLAPVGDTYWVQMQSSPILLSGTTVIINDTAPTGDRYNLSIVEILAAAGGATAGSISGTISPAPNGNVATVVLSQNGTTVATTTVGASGTYSFSNVGNGTYTLTPSETGFTFTPASQSVTVSGNAVTVPVFTATAVVSTYTVSGTISPAPNGNVATVTLSQNGTTVAMTTVGASGSYSFSNVANGTYVVTPSETGFTFTPTSQSVTVSGNPVTVPVFTATATGSAYTISGTITNGSGANVMLTQNGTTIATMMADTSGKYTFANLPNGTYTVTPTKTSFVFSPVNQTVTVNGSNVVVGNITATAFSGQLEYPDLSDIIPTADISVVGIGGSAEFQYTHDTYNGGPGPLVIQPAYNPASGTYQGTQYIYSLSSSGNWTLAQTVRVAGDFVFDSAHGHFHFPFTTYGLYTVGANGGPGTPVAASGKISFCINDSFIYNSSLPHAGALGNLGSCSDPTSLRGLDIGAVDEYDQTDDGQSISIAGVPNGTYWLRAIVDPDNYLAESSKANNETDVELTINGASVQILQTVIPVLPPPPSISLNSPADGSTVSSTVQLTASTAAISGVQFLIDGVPLGSVVLSSPYTLAWDPTTATNGSHWLAAQTTGPTGVIGTSAVIAVTVANSSSTPPTVQLTAPEAGATVSATVTVAANVASSEGIASVSFYVDGAQIGTSLTAPPYMTTWDTETAKAGNHNLTATAIDITGNPGTSAPVSVTVDNSHPPNLIGEDVIESVDGVGAMTTPAFATSQNGELLVAFVSYDGPSSAPQTATVSGSGLTWTLVKRSNHQAGTAEIWMAYASDAPETVSVTSQPGVGKTYHGSLTVIAFTNASGPGIVNQASAPTGPPDIYLPGVSAGNWVFAVGNDWDKAIGRTPVSGQVLVHQRLDTQVGDTYWVQSTTAPSTANALVDIHDSAPTTDQWNYAAVEIVATLQ